MSPSRSKTKVDPSGLISTLIQVPSSVLMVTSLKGRTGFDTSHDLERESLAFSLFFWEVTVILDIRRKSVSTYFIISENGFELVLKLILKTIKIIKILTS